MIVCSCNVITSANIQLTIERLVAENPGALITPGMVYHGMGHVPNCRGCMPHFVAMVYEILQKMQQDGRYLPPPRSPRPGGKDCEMLKSGLNDNEPQNKQNQNETQ